MVTALNGVQAPVTTGRRVAVTSARGGAGKTAVSALVGSVFAARRADPVVAVDAAPETGSLAWRLGTQPRGTLAELAQGLMAASSRNLADVARLLPRTPSGLWVVPGGSAGQRTIARDVTRALSRLFAVAVLDCGTGMQLPETTEVLADAHAVLVVTPATPDGVSSTVSALSGVQPGALQRVVIALNATDPHGHATLKSGPAREAFQRMGVPVVELPYDRHVAAGAVIDPGKIAETTFVAAANLAAWALHRAPQL
ncbi:chromosome partitioning protein [Kibdelosporangium phytohabitans]|uniref:Chromosome partitioning protein n=1 Tax=Kibdelosporangium phytohabitans TaxID=860235 RepID=A0A0N9IDK4_9PSEU|nr:chromosome partitioning protein [Kibdelosporangium phytohabitans]